MNDPRPVLDRLAATLNVPVEVFWGFFRSSNSDHGRLHECVELIEGFQQLQDHEARRRCLRFVQAELDQVNRSA